MNSIKICTYIHATCTHMNHTTLKQISGNTSPYQSACGASYWPWPWSLLWNFHHDRKINSAQARNSWQDHMYIGRVLEVVTASTGARVCISWHWQRKVIGPGQGGGTHKGIPRGECAFLMKCFSHFAICMTIVYVYFVYIWCYANAICY